MNARIDRNTMLSLMGASTDGSCKALSSRADRIARANGLTQYTKPGQPGYWYDRAEVMKASLGKAMPKAA